MRSYSVFHLFRHPNLLSIFFPEEILHTHVCRQTKPIYLWQFIGIFPDDILKILCGSQDVPDDHVYLRGSCISAVKVSRELYIHFMASTSIWTVCCDVVFHAELCCHAKNYKELFYKLYNNLYKPPRCLKLSWVREKHTSGVQGATGEDTEAPDLRHSVLKKKPKLMLKNRE